MGTTTDPTRLAMLARVNAGELDHSAAAKELGLTPGVWGLWRARHAKVAGGGKAKPAARKKAARKAKPAKNAREGRPPGSARRGRPSIMVTTRASAPTAGFAGVVEQLQRFGDELRERVRALIEMAERRFPG